MPPTFAGKRAGSPCIKPPDDEPERLPGESVRDWKRRVKDWRKAWKDYEKCLKGKG
jgi:hypothetical protein